MKRKGMRMAIAGTALALASALTAETPDKFIRYVEATGQQAVDVGVRGRYGVRMEATVEWTALADSAILDARANGDTDSRIYLGHCGGKGNISVACGSNYWTTRGAGHGRRNCLWQTGRTYTMETDFAVTNEVVTTETVVTNLVENPATGETSEVEETVTTTTTNQICKIVCTVDGIALDVPQTVYDLIDTGTNLYLFACNIQGTPHWMAKARCYGMKIWLDGALMRNFRPCMKDGRVGLYDAVSGTIFYSNTGTDLVYDAHEDVPDEFVEYVEARGNTYVDTEVIGRSGTRCEADLEWLAVNGDYGFLDARGTYGGDDRVMLIHTHNAGMAVAYGTFKGNYGHTYSTGTRYTVASELKAGSQTLVVNGETVYSAADPATYDTGRSLYLFGNNRGGSVDNRCRARLYGLKIWQDGALVRDFRPCRKRGVPALYDDVEKRIFYAAQKRLASPNDYTAEGQPDYFVDYLTANGTVSLDTGVRARAGTRAAGEMAWTRARTWNEEVNAYIEDVNMRPERTYLGAVNGESRFYMIHEAGAMSVWSGYGDQRTYPSSVTTNTVEEVVDNGDGTATTNNVEQVVTNDIAWVAGRTYAFDVSYAAGAQTIDLDGERILAKDSGASVDAGCNLYLFACNNNGTPQYEAPARCYGLKLWQDGALVRDFRPCVKDGKALLWDDVTKTLYRPVPDIPAAGNVGDRLPQTLTGDEKPDVYVEYVESDKTLFVDTGVIGRSGTTAELEMQWLGGTDDTFIGSRISESGSTGNSRFFMWHWASKSMGYGYGLFRYPKNGDPTVVGSNQEIADKVPAQLGTTYHVRSSLNAGSQRIEVNGTSIVDVADSLDLDTGYPLYIFACNVGGTMKYPSAARLYWLKLWQDGRLVRNFRPVRLDNNQAALWDSVTKQIFLPSKPFSAVGPRGEKVGADRNTVIIIR